MIPILEGVVPFARRALRERPPGAYAALSLAGTALLCMAVQTGQRMADPHAPMSLGEMALLWDLFAMGLLSVFGLLAAPAVAGAAMAQELRSGTVDGLRMTPLGPGGLVLGVALGSPAPAYLLCAGPALLHLLIGAFGPVPFSVAVSSLLLWAIGSLAMGLLCTALPLVVPRQRVSGGLAALPVLFFLWVSFVNMAIAASSRTAMFSFLTPAGAVTVLYLDSVQLLARHRYNFAEAASWLGLIPVLSAVFSAMLCGLGAMVAVRKLRDPECAALTQRQAVAWFYGGVGAMVLPMGILTYVWRVRGAGDFGREAFYLGIALLFSGLPLLLLFGGAATPVRARWARFLRGALHASEGAAPYRAIAAMAAALLCGAALLWGCEGLSHLASRPSEGGLVLLWGWMVLLLATGLQGARAVSATPGGAGALSLGLILTVVALLISLSFWEGTRPSRPEILLVIGGLLTVPLWIYLWERKVAKALRA
jgi:hypothetical protein